MTRFGRPLRRGLLAAATLAGLIGQDRPILNEKIKPLNLEELSYPLAARFLHVQGTVVVRVKLDDDGNVVSSEAISGAKSLIPECLANSKKWRFQPIDEKAAVIVYNFRIEGLCDLPCTSQFRFEPPNLAIIVKGEPVVDHSGK